MVLMAAALIISSACDSGKSPIGPTGPGVTELVAGRWRGILRLTEVRRNASRNYVDSCVRALPQFTVGTLTPVTLEVVGTGETQEEFFGTASGVSARLANLSTGSSCELHAWILPAVKWSVSLFASRCDPNVVTIRCDNGEVRELRLLNTGAAALSKQDVVVQLRVDGNSATGSVSETWDVFVAGNRAEEDRLYFWSELSVSRE